MPHLKAGVDDHQHDVRHGLSRQSRIAGLQRDKRRHRGVHALAWPRSSPREGIRVNGVAPGPIWTPLIPSTFPAEKVAKFGADTPMKRPGQPNEVASCFLFLACEDSSYMTGSVLHPNGGDPTES